MPDFIGTEEEEDPESEGGHNPCGLVDRAQPGAQHQKTQLPTLVLSLTSQGLWSPLNLSGACSHIQEMEMMKRGSPGATECILKLGHPPHTPHSQLQHHCPPCSAVAATFPMPSPNTAGPPALTASRPGAAAPRFQPPRDPSASSGPLFPIPQLPGCSALGWFRLAVGLARLDSSGLSQQAGPTHHIKGQLLDGIMAEQLEKASEAHFSFSSY